MPSTLLFVHGTGVRDARFTATLELLRRGARRRALDAEVRGCYWGQAEGAKLHAGGRSIPEHATTGGRAPTEADELLALWSMLYSDPWYELRLLRHMPAAGAIAPGQVPPSVRLLEDVEHYVPSDALLDTLDAVELRDPFTEALAALRAAPELGQAAATAPVEPLEHRRAIARALVAQALVTTEDADRPPVDGETRDELVGLLTDELRGHGLGVGDFLLRPFKGLAARAVTRKLTGDRGAIADAAAPFAGDVMRFLSHGDGARRFLRAAIGDCDGRVFLLGHSLGGIMCVDLLVRGVIDPVAGLITVGSQAPFLYEIGALPSLAHPDPLPDHFPAWTNVYDRRDLLAYVGAGVFGDRVTDVAVDNGQPFPQSHSAYWTNTALWDAVEAAVG